MSLVAFDLCCVLSGHRVTTTNAFSAYLGTSIHATGDHEVSGWSTARFGTVEYSDLAGFFPMDFGRVSLLPLLAKVRGYPSFLATPVLDAFVLACQSSVCVFLSELIEIFRL